MRILFMGTPEIAAVMLKELAKKHEICGVFCQPDKPVGRKQILTPPAVKVAAEELGIPVFQPVKLRDGSAEALIRDLDPEMIAVVAYGRILPKAILDIPPKGCVNIHASLLPKYRGAAPIQYALLMGEEKTGLTAMYMDEGLDTGDIIEQVTMDLPIDEDAVSLFERMAEEGAKLLVKTADDIAAGTAARIPQNNDEATFAPPFTKETGEFTFEETAFSIHNKVRALCMWPNAVFVAGDKRVKVLKSALAEGSGKPGEVLALDPLTVAAGEGAVALLEVKPEGSRLMTGKEYAAGRRLAKGDILL